MSQSMLRSLRLAAGLGLVIALLFGLIWLLGNGEDPPQTPDDRDGMAEVPAPSPSAAGRELLGSRPTGPGLRSPGIDRNARADARWPGLRQDLDATFDLQVDPFGAISGRILGPDGEPLVGFSVWVDARDQATSIGESSASRPDGRFLVRDLDPECEFTVGVSGGYTPARVALLPTHSDWLRPGAHEVVLRMQAGVFLTGRLLDSGDSEEPRAGLVRAKEIDAGEEPYQASAFVGRDGSFCVGPVPPGEYELIGDANVPDRGPSEPIRASAPEDDIILVVTEQLSRKGRIVGGNKVGGFVLDWFAQGAEAPRRRRFRAGLTGDFEIGPLAEDDTALVYVWKQGDMRYALLPKATYAEEALEVRIHYGRWIEGRVEFRAATKTSTHRGSIVTRSLEHGFKRVDRMYVDGTFLVGGLPPGEYELSYRPTTLGYSDNDKTGPTVRATSGSPAEDIVLRAPR